MNDEQATNADNQKEQTRPQLLEYLSQSAVRYKAWTQQSLSPWIRRRLWAETAAGAGAASNRHPLRQMALTQNYTQALLTRLQRRVETGIGSQSKPGIELSTPARLFRLSGDIVARHQAMRPASVKYRPQPVASAPNLSQGGELVLAGTPPLDFSPVGQETPGFKVGSIIPPMPKKSPPRPAASTSPAPEPLPSSPASPATTPEEAVQRHLRQRAIERQAGSQPQPPAVQPRSRIFSRVEEVAPGQESSRPENPAEPVAPVLPTVPVEESHADNPEIEPQEILSEPDQPAQVDSELDSPTQPPLAQPLRQPPAQSKPQLPQETGLNLPKKDVEQRSLPEETKAVIPPPETKIDPSIHEETELKGEDFDADLKSPPTQPRTKPVQEESSSTTVEMPLRRETPSKPVTPADPKPPIAKGSGESIRRKEKTDLESKTEVEELPRQELPPEPDQESSLDFAKPAAPETIQRQADVTEKGTVSEAELPLPEETQAADVTSVQPKVDPGVVDRPPVDVEMPLRRETPAEPIEPAIPTPASEGPGEKVQRQADITEDETVERAVEPPGQPKVDPTGGDKPPETVEMPLRREIPAEPIEPAIPTPASEGPGEKVQRKADTTADRTVERAVEPPVQPQVDPGVVDRPTADVEMPLRREIPAEPTEPAISTPPISEEPGERVQRKADVPEAPTVEVADEPLAAQPKRETTADKGPTTSLGPQHAPPPEPAIPLDMALRSRATTRAQLPLHQSRSGADDKKRDGIEFPSLIRRQLRLQRVSQVREGLMLGTNRAGAVPRPMIQSGSGGSGLVLRKPLPFPASAPAQRIGGIRPDPARRPVIRRQVDNTPDSGPGGLNVPSLEGLPPGLAQLGQPKVRVSPSQESESGPPTGGPTSPDQVTLGQPKITVVPSRETPPQPSLELVSRQQPEPLESSPGLASAPSVPEAGGQKVVAIKPDLNRLAVAIYPLVKRLMALERERRPGF